MPERIRIGQIVGTHGLKGHVKVDPLTDFADRFDKGQRVFLNDDWHEIRDVRWHKGRPVIRIDGFNGIDEAEKLKWLFLEGLAENRPELSKDEYFTEDLFDCEVFTTAGEKLGIVDDVLANPAHDILQVGEILIPVVKQFVKSVDVKGKRITVELIEGMRPGEAAE